MKQRIIALCLALALTAALGVSALAEEEAAAPEAAQDTPQSQQSGTGTESGEADPEDAGAETAEQSQAPSAAGPDDGAEDAAYDPDPVGTVRFENLERRMRQSSLSVLALQESIDAIEGMDYDTTSEVLRQRINLLAGQLWGLSAAGQSGTYQYTLLEQSYAAAREQFEAIAEGELQEDNDGFVRQLKNGQDQVIMAGETLYVTLAALEIQYTALQRQLTALNRTVEELELRHELGQISALQLEQTKAQRTALESGLETMEMNVANLKLQLELLIGAELTGEIALGSVPEVTEEDLAAMDLEADLAAAKAQSYELYAADQTLADAKDTYAEAMKGDYYLREAAVHTWQAAQYTHQSTIADYELRFRTLYAQVNDYHQVLEAAEVSLASQQASYAASELKYRQGTLSEHGLLDARDALDTAEEAVRTASIDLFSAYNTYCWAVDHGILN